MLKNYIWDLDGTLLDSYGSIVSSLVRVSRETGGNDSEDEIMKAVKQGSVSSFLRGMAEKCETDYAMLYRRYREISHDRLGEIILMPGTLTTLEGLKRAGADHYVYTHRGNSTGPLLKRLGITGYFREIVTFSNGFKPKPSGEGVEYLVQKYALEKQKTAYVGDRELDIQCAKNAGVKAVLLCPKDSWVRPCGLEDLVIERLEELIP